MPDPLDLEIVPPIRDRGIVFFFDSMEKALWVTDIQYVVGGFTGLVNNGAWYIHYQDTIVNAYYNHLFHGTPTSQSVANITHQVAVEPDSGRDYNDVIEWARTKIKST